MRRSLPDHLDLARYPLDPWRLVEREHDATDLGLTETLFAVGNGYLGMRANPEEGREAYSHGTFINGFHETWSIHHAEEAFGFAKLGQTIVNVPDAKLMKLYVDDEPLLLTNADLEAYERVLDFREGTLDPRPRLAHAGGQARAGPVAAPRLARPPPPGDDDVRGHAARRDRRRSSSRRSSSTARTARTSTTSAATRSATAPTRARCGRSTTACSSPACTARSAAASCSATAAPTAG